MMGMGQEGYPESVDSESASTDLTVGNYTRTPLRIAERPPMTPLQKTFSGLFYGQLLVQLAACVCLLSTQNVYSASNAECGSSYELDAHRNLCIKPGLKSQLDSCVPAETTVKSGSDDWDRRLDEQPRRSGGMASRNGELLLSLLGGVALVCLGWFLFLGTFAHTMTWGMLAANVILMCYMFYLTSNWMLLVTAAVIVVLAYLARTRIEVAIQAMKLASVALRSTPCTFVVCLAFRMGWFVYAVGISCVGFFTQTSRAVGPDCELRGSWAADVWLACCPVLLVLTTLFFKSCMLSVVAMSVGCWYFPEQAADLREEACGNPALYGGKLALTTSSGSVFGSALIMGVVEAFKRGVDHPCWWMDPTMCALKALSVALEGTVGMLTRFALIAHIFHGGGLCHLGAVTKELLSRHLPDAVATGFLANVIMNQIAMGLSTCFGFLVWFLLDQRENIGVFKTIRDLVVRSADTEEDFTGTQQFVAMLTWSMYLGARRPISTLFWSGICMILAPFVDWLFSRPGLLESYLTAQAMAALASVIFTYMGSVLEYATDTVFYCMAVESENGRCDARTVKLHESMQKQLEEEEAAADQKRRGGRSAGIPTAENNEA
uniref:Choline transporter-like protein n=1 Tax=Alexandrium monilatum TaxID=311494 RepID=A0A7S4V684_9DINO